MGLADVAGARELGEPVEPELVEPWEPDALDPGTLCTPPSNPEHAATAMANAPDPGRSACSRTVPAPDSAYPVACPGVALPWLPVPPASAAASLWTSTAQ